MKETIPHYIQRTQHRDSGRRLWPFASFSGLLSGLFCAGILIMPTSQLLAADNNQSLLQSIKQKIAETEKNVKQQQEQRRGLVVQLQNQEKVVAQASRKLHQSRQQLIKLNKDIKELELSVKALKKKQKTQESILARQLDAAFRQGEHSSFQFIFNGEASQRSERILAYFGYLNTARQHAINSLNATRQALSAQQIKLENKQQQQNQLLNQQKQQQVKLENARSARQKTLTSLESSLQKNQADLAEMRRNERQLQEKIKRAEQQARARALREAREAEQVRKRQAAAKAKGSTYKPSASEQSLMARTGGLGKPQGQALWPVRGRVAHNFGEALQGELRWKGVVIDAPEGTEVKAIADGRVLMADWLQGYGLVVVIEHGKGDMSLYGYNQSALVSPGTQVKAGEPVALVGTSGGRGSPSLYFEIRRQGQTVNPLPWLGK